MAGLPHRYFDTPKCRSIALPKRSFGGGIGVASCNQHLCMGGKNLAFEFAQTGTCRFIPLRLRAATMRLRLERSGASNLMARLRAFVKQAITCDDFVAIKQ
jgi:hypothetical protein